MVLLRIILALLLLLNAAYAGGRGGSSKTFDPNSYGGNWACVRSMASGTCGVATTQYFDAACDGTTDDSAARLSWIAYGLSQGSLNLYFPPGSRCNITGASCINATCTSNDPVIPKMVVWAYGASINNVQYGGLNLYDDNNHGALFQSANAGDTALTLVTAADAAIFAVNDYVLVSGLSRQKGGSPPNFQYYEYKIVTSITGTTTKVLNLSSALKNSYLSTWPLIDDVFTGGPATVYKLQPSWNGHLTIHGLQSLTPFQVNVKGRTNILYDLQLNPVSDVGPSMNESVWFIGGEVGSPEVDKNIIFSEFFRTIGSSISYQSPSPESAILDSINLRRSLNGTGKNISIQNSTIPDLRVGPSGFSGGLSINLDGSVITAGQPTIGINVLMANMSFSSGVLSIANDAPSINNAWGWADLTSTYCFADSDGTCNSSPTTTFKISSITTNGTSTFYAMSNCSWGACSGSLPSPTCNGHACTRYGLYPALSITQKFTGPADLTQYAAP